ncbi:MAG: ketopantoate reductase family protein [Candidatus Handelsmanbacteria bacterium]|nr:ketopantoate reductase family protein [Candidatus Handelsmanbacteria bacterium]
MHIAVIGAGNMGCLYGANLARAGAQITLIDPWAEQVQQIQQQGLSMEGLHGAFTVHPGATVDPVTLAGQADLVLVLVGAGATPAAAATARQVLKDTGFALTLQNGLGNLEALQEVLGAGRVMAGMTFHSADLQSPGRVVHTNKGATYLGEQDQSRTPRLALLCEWMERADMNPVIEEDIRATMWGKFVLNCSINALCAITDLRPGHIRQVPELDAFQTGLVEELLALVRARGIQLPNPAPLEEIKAYSAKKFHRVSMLQHLARGRQTEIDALNGYAVRECKKLGLPCPCNEALTALIKGRQCLPTEEGQHDPEG